MFYFLSDHSLAFISLGAILICCLGLFGNVLSTLVLVQKSMRSSWSMVLIGLTIFDSFHLLTFIALYGISWSFHYYFPVHDLISLDIYTSVVYPLKRTAYSASVYATMLISTERFLAECYQSRSLTLKGVRNCLIGVTLFAILINIPRWFEHEIVETLDGEGHFLEITLIEHETYLLYYEELLWSTSMYIVPFFFILVTNIFIWYKQLNQRNPYRQQIVPVDDEEEHNLTRMLLTVPSVFFILNALNCVFVVFYISTIGWKSITSETLGNLPIVINSSIKFIIYITLGQKFRKEFLKLFRHYWSCCCRGVRTPMRNAEPIPSFGLQESHSQASLNEH